jgi:PAS domain S-box-containing protein
LDPDFKSGVVILKTERIELITELRDLSPGDHVCLLYNTEEERREIADSFLREGLERGQKILYVGEDGSPSEICEGLRRMGLDIGTFRDSGQLSFISAKEVYTPDGTFHPQTTLEFWAREVDRAAAKGWGALRAASDMSWALAEPPGHELLAQYEAEINRIPLAGDCVFLCQYDGRRFPPEALLDLLRTHPKVAVGMEVYDNIYYVPPGEFLNNMVPQSVLAYHLSHLRERKQAVLEIQSARKYAEAIVNTMREPLLVLDAELRVVTANRSFYLTFHNREEETVGRLVYELGNRQWDIPKLRKFLEEIIPQNTSFDDFEVEHVFPHIGRRTMLLNARRIYREANKTDMILLAIEDISERKRAEEHLRMLNRMFLSLGADFFANMETVVATFREILRGALAAYSRMERGKMTMITTATGENGFLVSDDPSRFLFSPLLSGELAAPMVLPDLQAMGEARNDPLVERHGFRSYAGYPVTHHGNTIGVLSLYDREPRHYGEDDVETMAILARTLSIEEERLAREEFFKDFIDVASHELRHPITLIKGYALSLREWGLNSSEEQTRMMLTAIDEGSDRLTRLVEGLVNISRIERGHFSFDLREAELFPLLEQVMQQARKPHQVILLRQRGKIGTCRLNPERFVELVNILLDNAAKFSPPEGTIEVEVESREKDYLISVLDRGIGVPEGLEERIFERFYQVEDARHHSSPGMGMGLFIAREIVERHHGKIWYEPREGGGSAFRFTLPKER